MEDSKLDQSHSDHFKRDFDALIAIDRALVALDEAFTRLSDPGFAELPRPYKRLADAVLKVYASGPLTFGSSEFT